MRKVYRGVINERESKQEEEYIKKYRDGKLTVLDLANIFKYCHGTMKLGEDQEKIIR